MIYGHWFGFVLSQSKNTVIEREAPMKVSLALCIFFTLAIPAKSQTEKVDVRTLLSDAAYTFNRYEETTIGLENQIDTWDVPADTKVLFKQELAAVRRNLAAEKPRLNALLQRSQFSPIDLLDVYMEIVEVAGDLDEEASNYSNWGHVSGKAIEFAQLAAKTNIVGVKLGFALRGKLVAQEELLEICPQRRPASRATTK